MRAGFSQVQKEERKPEKYGTIRSKEQKEREERERSQKRGLNFETVIEESKQAEL